MPKFHLIRTTDFVNPKKNALKMQRLAPLTQALKRFHYYVIAGLMCIQTNGADIADSGRASVVKITVSTQGGNYSQPWQGQRVSGGSGSGFIIKGKRILTNAHLIADAKFIQVQREGDAERYRANVAFAAHDCDLAILTVESDAFFDDTRPLPLAKLLPDLNDDVTVLGYPLGGDRLSITKGVVSRVDFSNYSHSNVDQHLALQVDAAINPGNSGGPVLYNKEVVGVAFQGLSWAENIGYAIPLPVITRFLDDVADGTYHGYAELGVVYRNTHNPALRKDLGLSERQTGVALSFIDPFGAAHKRLLPRDVILDINGHPVSNDGSIRLDEKRVMFSEITERMQWGDLVSFRIWRDGREIAIPIPLDHPKDPFVFRNQYDVRPNYLIRAGLVFSPLSAELLRTMDRNASNSNIQQLYYTFGNVKRDALYRDRTEFVVLMARLPHSVNTYAENFVYGIVTQANGLPIADLAGLKQALGHSTNAFHVIQFQNMDAELVLDAIAADAADEQIRNTYGIQETEYITRRPKNSQETDTPDE